VLVNPQFVAEPSIKVSLSADKTPGLMSWQTTLIERTRPTVFGDMAVLQTSVVQSIQSTRTAIITESEGINKLLYDSVPLWIDNFDIVYTHSSRILDIYPEKARFKPGGAFLIGSNFAPGHLGVLPKSKLCSLLTSSKQMCPMHHFRLQVAKRLEGSGVDVTISDVYGNAFDHLEKYYFSICIENFLDKAYFTERILNCFATGTIPIYMGASHIENFFDKCGIYTFRSFEELNLILKKISSNDYYFRLPSVIENFYRVQRYSTIEDYIVSNYGLTAFG